MKNKTREEVLKEALDCIDNYYDCIILNLITGFGKTRISIEMANKICDKVYNEEKRETNILILVAKTVHKKVWIDELNKWHIKTNHIKIECYESMKKYVNTHWDILIMDEQHHINSELRLGCLKHITINRLMIGLSATIPKDVPHFMTYVLHKRVYVIKCGLKEAIENNVLPAPKVFVVPLNFDDTVSETIVLHPAKASYGIIRASYRNRWGAMKIKDKRVEISCTKTEYYEYINSTIDYYRRVSYRSRVFENMLMSICLRRLHWLSNLKNDMILSLLSTLKDYRVLTFCNSIEQTRILGRNCINSKNKDYMKVLEDFNNHKTDHITSCNMLNESVNLIDCKIGIYANLTASTIMTKQRCGRILRHKEPIMIVPYYRHTREEEIVNKMMDEYDPKTVFTLKPEEIGLFLKKEEETI